MTILKSKLVYKFTHLYVNNFIKYEFRLTNLINSLIISFLENFLFLRNYYILNDLIWQDGFLIDFLQKKVVDKLFKKKGEVYFKFTINQKSEINTLTKIISIDNVENKTVYAFANKQGFTAFLPLNYTYAILPNPNTLRKVKMGKQHKSTSQIQATYNTYPTYPAYESMMNQFVVNYPTLCKLVNIGTLPSGKKLLMLKISDNINVRENEPQFLYTSSMHGDEIAGYVGMLHYIDYLLI